MRVFGKALFVFVLVGFIATPGVVSARTISVTQVITISARVADARSIIVNDKGQMTKIYSNTAKNVEPKVYLHQVHGESRALTPELLAQYKAIMARQKQAVGVEIPIEQPVASTNDAPKLLFGTMSTLLQRAKL